MKQKGSIIELQHFHAVLSFPPFLFVNYWIWDVTLQYLLQNNVDFYMKTFLFSLIWRHLSHPLLREVIILPSYQKIWESLLKHTHSFQFRSIQAETIMPLSEKTIRFNLPYKAFLKLMLYFIQCEISNTAYIRNPV